ncbi:MAG: DUF2946 domain-containing protein [Bradyrhizobium sp.]|uniref:DUF2946 domain-containing protein n=1 Tax=Bradyrhizobium sp. TaxID=376 RepID=UPI001C28B729|nr:DUF2946 domain-containing protein [Bradyrhizobium sp.]MBU6463614.1 DUF2946 domain-containing protein [Pseudomonadota bacterium]MDE2067930.1 DUF2946 domain-containing protein [Bradyrhizobium sp.]MDE2241744.1 DUF2946 domain-containing protein [Bradyrhizobium sp.]
MKWFRANIKQGSKLALLALALQFVLSFGHFHGVAHAATAIRSGTVLTAQVANPRQQPVSDHDSDRHANDSCAICAVIAMANAVLFATPPLLRLPEAVEFLYQTTDSGFIDLNSVRVAFQPRAPPIS